MIDNTNIPTANSSMCPFRPGSTYSTIFQILLDHRQQGINRDLLKVLVKKELRRQGIKKSFRQIGWDISIISSSRLDNERLPHRSVRNAADVYAIEAVHNWLRLHLRNEENAP